MPHTLPAEKTPEDHYRVGISLCRTAAVRMLKQGGFLYSASMVADMNVDQWLDDIDRMQRKEALTA